MTVVRFPFPAALAEHEASFDEPPLAMLDRLAVPDALGVTAVEAAVYRPCFTLSLVGWLMIGITAVGSVALATVAFGSDFAIVGTGGGGAGTTHMGSTGAMQKREWVQTSPGELTLNGTAIRIVYAPHSEGDFALWQGAIILRHDATLAMAKLDGEDRQAELDEIGAK